MQVLEIVEQFAHVMDNDSKHIPKTNCNFVRYHKIKQEYKTANEIRKLQYGRPLNLGLLESGD